MKAIVAAVVLAALGTAGLCWYVFAGSGAPRLDGSSEASFQTSIAAVKQALPRAQHGDFDEALAMLLAAKLMPPTGDGASTLTAVLSLAADPASSGRRLREVAHGMTAAEVIAQGTRAAADFAARRGGGRGAAGVAPVPPLHARRLEANESAAIATLRNLAAAQRQCQAVAAIDVDCDGAGEHGYFAELAGRAPLRGGTGRLAPPLLLSALGDVVDARVTRNGYLFQLYLPDAGACGVAEVPPGGGGAGEVDPTQAEVVWCCYAWPLERGRSGARAFFVDQTGVVLATDGAVVAYDGTQCPPRFQAAYGAAGPATMAAAAAADAVGHDGNAWRVLR